MSRLIDKPEISTMRVNKAKRGIKLSTVDTRKLPHEAPNKCYQFKM